MDTNEWCALVHVDIDPRADQSVVADLLRDLVDEARSSDEVIVIGVLRPPARPNHLELIGRYRSETDYVNHLVSPANLAFRWGVGKLIGSPYEDRLHGPRGEQSWPLAKAGDTIVVTQIEIRPADLNAALPLVEAVARGFGADGTGANHALLQRYYRPNNLEIVSAWSEPDDFLERLNSDAMQESREALDQFLLAPIDDRSGDLFFGEWDVS